jgi:hypothetical protein
LNNNIRIFPIIENAVWIDESSSPYSVREKEVADSISMKASNISIRTGDS